MSSHAIEKCKCMGCDPPYNPFDHVYRCPVCDDSSVYVWWTTGEYSTLDVVCITCGRTRQATGTDGNPSDGVKDHMVRAMLDYIRDNPYGECLSNEVRRSLQHAYALTIEGRCQYKQRNNDGTQPSHR